MRREDNFQGVSQGLVAQISVWELRCVQGKLEIRRGRGIGCADVGRNAEKCVGRMPYKAYIDGCLRRCRVKGEEENMREEHPDSSLALRMTGWGSE